MQRAPLLPASWVVAAVSAALVGGFIAYELHDLSPGPLSSAHAQVAEFDGGNNCAACHGNGDITLRDACLTCHRDIGEQVARREGLHGSLPADRQDHCAACHVEHHGDRIALTNAISFKLAGIERVAEFDHSQVDFKLSGDHVNLACTACHRHAASAVLPQGARRFGGLKQDCRSCHSDVHEGRYGYDCASCHGQSQPFEMAAQFRHSPQFELSGSHANLSCNRCHADGSEFSVASALDRAQHGLPLAAPRECTACHDSPHTPALIDFVSTLTGVHPGASCQHCHSTSHSTFRGPLATIDDALHAQIGFPLAAPHSGLRCEQCHSEYGSTKPLEATFAVPARGADDCRACHGDPHAGQFDKSAPGGQADCLSCHASEHFVPAQFGLIEHAATRFPLHGRHRELICRECHVTQDTQLTGELLSPKNPHSVTVFRGTPVSCQSCHRDPHGGQFENGTLGGSDCRACHGETAFGPARFTHDHHRATRFPLTGAHRAVGCNDCHTVPAQGVAAAADDLAGIRRFTGTPTRCDSCHADVHPAGFVRGDPHGRMPARQDCSLCHTTESFDDVDQRAFDHGRWTGFVLRGAHAQVHCAACHVDAKVPDANGRIFGVAQGTRCSDCHRDPHAGQFDLQAIGDCAACHTEQGSFRELEFDHQQDSKFPLDEIHIKLNCAACHRSYRMPNGQDVVRYKPLGRECADCHLPNPSGGRQR